jgi:membrane associated rhomboid family serine protease
LVPSGRRDTRTGSFALGVLLIGACLLAWSSALHLYLYTYYFYRVPTIGPLFIAQGATGSLLAAATVVFRKALLAVAGALLLAFTAGALLFSVWFGLFGYHERLSAPYTGQSLGVEAAGALALAGAATLLAVRTRR